MNITLLKYPTDEDWAFAKQCALVTIGKEMKTAPDMEWKHSILRAQHSPIRTLQFAFYLEGVPYWVSTHLARHVHAQPFIRSQRNDRQDEYDRNAARQDAPVDMIWYMNAELRTGRDNGQSFQPATGMQSTRTATKTRSVLMETTLYATAITRHLRHFVQSGQKYA